MWQDREMRGLTLLAIVIVVGTLAMYVFVGWWAVQAAREVERVGLKKALERVGEGPAHGGR